MELINPLNGVRKPLIKGGAVSLRPFRGCEELLGIGRRHCLRGPPPELLFATRPHVSASTHTGASSDSADRSAVSRTSFFLATSACPSTVCQTVASTP